MSYTTVRGTTPIHSFTLPEELRDVEFSALYITYTQGGTVRLEKSLTEVSVQEGVITVYAAGVGSSWSATAVTVLALIACVDWDNGF